MDKNIGVIERRETLAKPSLKFSVDTNMTPAELRELARNSSMDTVVRSPHVGAQHGNQTAVLLPYFEGVGLHNLDMNTLQRDQDFQPGYRIIPGESRNTLEPIVEIPDSKQDDRFVAHVNTNTTVDVGGKLFRPGSPLVDVHIESIRSVVGNPERVKSFSELFTDAEDIYRAVTEALDSDELASSMQRVVRADGTYYNIDKNETRDIVRQKGFHRLDDRTKPEEGVVLPLDAMIVAHALVCARNTGANKLWHIAGSDMIEYIQGKRINERIRSIYQAAYRNLPETSQRDIDPNLEVVILPGSGLRFFAQSENVSTLESIIQTYAEFKEGESILAEQERTRKKLVGKAVQELFKEHGGRVPNLDQRKREISAQLPSDHIIAKKAELARVRENLVELTNQYPEPYKPATAEHCITQWHMLEDPSMNLELAPSFENMSLGSLAEMQAELSQIYNESNR